MTVDRVRSTCFWFGVVAIVYACSAADEPGHQRTAALQGFRHAPEEEPIAWLDSGILVRRLDRWIREDVFQDSCDGTGLFVLRPSGSYEPLWVGREICELLGAAQGVDLGPDDHTLVVGREAIWRADLLSRQTSKIYERCLPPVNSPAWSPAGNRIAFAASCEEPSERSVLHLMNADGSDVRPLGRAPLGTMESDPTWAPDGHHIAFVRIQSGALPGASANPLDTLGFARPGAPEIIVADTLGAGQRALAKGYAPAWDPTGQWIAYIALDTLGKSSSSIQLVRPDGSDARTLLRVPRSATPAGDQPEGPLVWSRDGKALVFPRGDSTGTAIWEVRVDGSGLRRVSPPPSRASTRR